MRPILCIAIAIFQHHAYRTIRVVRNGNPLEPCQNRNCMFSRCFTGLTVSLGCITGNPDANMIAQEHSVLQTGIVGLIIATNYLVERLVQCNNTANPISHCFVCNALHANGEGIGPPAPLPMIGLVITYQKARTGLTLSSLYRSSPYCNTLEKCWSHALYAPLSEELQ